MTEKKSIFSKIAWFFTKKYRITVIFWIIILLAGFSAYSSTLKREGFPQIEVPFVLVQGTYFTDNPKAVDQKVVEPITDTISDLEYIKDFQTTADANFYNIIIELEEGSDPVKDSQEIKSLINDNATLPRGADSEVSAIEPAKFNAEYNLILAVYGDSGSSYKDLEAKANAATETFTATESVEKTEVVPVIETVTNPFTGDKEQRQTSINKLGIKENGQVKFYPAVSIGITKTDSTDDIQLSKDVSNAIENLQKQETFEGYKFKITADFATTINQQLDSLQNNLIGGLIAVLVIALLLISWRAALVIALFIPTVMAGSFLGLQLLGYTLNVITLFALILTLGLFVDDATIIVEAIDAHKKNKKSRLDIIKTSVGRVGLASLAGTLTTILVFSPMLYVSGILGEFIRLLPITVILALSISFVVSIVLVPFLSRPLVLSKSKKLSFLDRLSILLPLEKRTSSFLASLPLLNKTDKKKGLMVSALMVGISIIAIIGAGVFANKIKLDIFPESKDSNILQAQIDFKEKATIQNAETLTNNVDNQIVNTLGDELDYITYISGNENSALIEIGLTPYTERNISSQVLSDNLTNQVAVNGVDVKFSQRDAGPPGQDFPFQMRIYSDNAQTLDKLSKDIQGYLQDKELDISSGNMKITEVKIEGTDTINRATEGRFVTILAKFNEDDASSAAVIATKDSINNEYTEEKLAKFNLTKDAFDFDVSQESENEDSFNSIGTGLIIALVMMYVLLVILYNSFSQPLLIFMAIPFSLFGVFFGLWATDNVFSFFTMLGLLGLIGIVVNNTILLTEYANQEKESGKDRYQAISNAVRERFRPLITTTLTTIFALLPLSISDPLRQ